MRKGHRQLIWVAFCGCVQIGAVSFDRAGIANHAKNLASTVQGNLKRSLEALGVVSNSTDTLARTHPPTHPHTHTRAHIHTHTHTCPHMTIQKGHGSSNVAGRGMQTVCRTS